MAGEVFQRRAEAVWVSLEPVGEELQRITSSAIGQSLSKTQVGADSADVLGVACGVPELGHRS
jgi:hypothetical protein